MKRTTLMPALEYQPRSPDLRESKGWPVGSSGTAASHWAREREVRVLLDEHRQHMLDQAWREAEETKEDGGTGMSTPERGSISAEDRVMRFYGSGWDDMGDYLGEGEAHPSAASRRARQRARLRAEEEEWQRAVERVTVQVGGARGDFTSTTRADTSMLEFWGGQGSELPSPSPSSPSASPSGSGSKGKWQMRSERLAEVVGGCASQPSRLRDRVG